MDRCKAVVFRALAGALALQLAQPDLAADAPETATLDAQITRMNRSAPAVVGRISADFSEFAGSPANAEALVAGLRSGSAITLVSLDPKGVPVSTTITPPTGNMGYGNVYTSLALAKQQLAALGITNPTPQQIEAALTGGTVTAAGGQATALTGVLQLRSQGLGWGQIAQSLGFKLGPVISGMRSASAHASAPPAAPAAATGQGSMAGRGIVTGAGTSPAGAGQGNAHGRGIVSGAGQSGSQGSGQGKSAGKGG